MDAAIRRGTDAFTRLRWAEAYEELSTADHEATTALEPEYLERLATAAYLIGRTVEATATWTRAHHRWLDHGDAERAVRCAFWISLTSLLNGDAALSSGWRARVRRLVDDPRRDGPEQGYLLLLLGLEALDAGDAEGALASFERATELGERFGDIDLSTLALLSCGEALVQTGDHAHGVTRLDEAMVGVMTGQVSPIAAGIVYCAVIGTCQRIFDIRRSREWTAALHDWCTSQPGLVPFRGECMVHRSEIMQLRGAWPAAVEEARRAHELLSQPPRPAVGDALYQLGELHRLHGEFRHAEDAYVAASHAGREPQPGLSLLRLAQDRVDAAAAAIRRAIAETNDIQGPGAGVPRARLLGPFIEIMLAAHDRGAARDAANELSAIAERSGTPWLDATCAQAVGAVLLGEGAPGAALKTLRGGATIWQELDVPYERARVDVLIGIACGELGDDETSEMHLDSARTIFRRLGAVPDLALVDEISRKRSRTVAGGLTAREVEVLRLVAAGRTNREVADALVISERTVARHMSNIMTKLGVSTRTAAGAFAFEHGLV